MRRLTSLAASIGLFLAACETTSVEQQALVFPEPPEKPRYVFEQTIFGSHAVKETTSADRFKVFATGAQERGKGFSKPYDVAAMNGVVYVSDTVKRHVAKLDFVNMQYDEIGKAGDGKLVKPMGIAVDGIGRLYVADATAKKVVVFDASGKFLRNIGKGRGYERLTSVAVNKAGSRIFVLDTGGVASPKHEISVFDAQGKFLQMIGRRGGLPGRFNLPLQLTIGPDENLYVMDSGNFRVQVFKQDGTFIREFGEAGRTPGKFSHPKGIAVDGAGRVYVSDSAFAIFQIYDRDANVLMFIGERDTAPRPAKFMLPAGMAVDVDGRVYAVDQYHRKVDVFRPAYLSAEAVIGTPASEPEGWNEVLDDSVEVPDVPVNDEQPIDPEVMFYDPETPASDEPPASGAVSEDEGSQ